MKSTTLKALTYIAIAIVSAMLFTSCEVEDYEEATHHNYVFQPGTVTDYKYPTADVIETMLGEYDGQYNWEKDHISITSTTIVINTADFDITIDIATANVIDSQINCFIEILLADGTVLKISLGWHPDTPQDRNLLFIKRDGQYISSLKRVDSQ